MNQIITRGEDIIVEAQVHLVFINKDGKPVKIPEDIYTCLLYTSPSPRDP